MAYGSNADEDHLIDVVRGEAGGFQGKTAAPKRALHQFHGEDSS